MFGNSRALKSFNRRIDSRTISPRAFSSEPNRSANSLNAAHDLFMNLSQLTRDHRTALTENFASIA